MKINNGKKFNIVNSTKYNYLILIKNNITEKYYLKLSVDYNDSIKRYIKNGYYNISHTIIIKNEKELIDYWVNVSIFEFHINLEFLICILQKGIIIENFNIINHLNKQYYKK